MPLKCRQDSLNGFQRFSCPCTEVLFTEDGWCLLWGKLLIPVPDSNERDSQRHAYSGGNGADFIKEPFARNNLFLLDGLHEQGVWPWFMQDKAAHCLLAQRKINGQLVTLPFPTVSLDGLSHVYFISISIFI
jgi:hypothetical protein